MSPVPETYNVPQNVTLSCTVSGATIRYTTDGTEPTEASPTYSTPVAVGASATLKAKAFKSGWTNSATAAGPYTMQAGTPTFSPGTGAYTGAQTVTVSTATPGATLHYTTNGADPTTTDPTVVSGGTVAVGQSLTLKAIAVKAGWTTSQTGFASYWITQGSVATPTLTPAPGSFAGTVTLTLATTTSGAVIRYTTDGTTPTLSSPAYASALTLNDTTTIRAVGFKSDHLPSAEATGTYTLTTSAVATPTLQPGSGNYAGAVTVTVSCSTAGATIRYTTNGLDPTATDATVASGATVQVPQSLMLKVKAFKSGMTDSAVRRGNYVLGGAIAAGGSHSLALVADRTVRAWGFNQYGQVGDGTTTQRNAPVQVAGLTNVVALAAGARHSLALKADGTVWGWGQNSNGQLGDGTTTNRLVAIQAVGLTGVIAIAAGDSFSLGVKSDGTVWGWGNNSSGQLGDGTTTQRTTAVQVPGLAGVTQVRAGANFSMALKTDGAPVGSVWTWGYNGAGQLGDGTQLQRLTPVRVLQLATGIGTGSGTQHALAVTSDGKAWGWGYNLSGQVGDGTAVMRLSPVQVVPGSKTMTQVAGGGGHTIAVDGQGVVWTWGHNGNGQLGEGTASGARSTPGFVSWLTRITQGSAGDAHSLALKDDGSVWAWGYNISGQLGDGTTTQRTLPVQILAAWDVSWLEADPDQDGLVNRRELAVGSDPLNPDTNGDGIRDGAAVTMGKSPTNPDMDGDGVANSVEITKRTDPFRVDTDGDGSNDFADCFPLDSSRSQCPSPGQGDTTPPVITLTEPSSAVLIGSTPP
jgi:alpha-tubulin suppressor-like RCC1 family protein